MYDSQAYADGAPVYLREAGTYKVRIVPLQDTVGNYQFRLLNVASQPAVTFGATNNGSFSVAGETDLYRINAVAGQVLNFDNLSLGSGFSGGWILYSPNNTYVNGTSLDADFSQYIRTSGEWLLSLRDERTLGGAVTYSFQTTNIGDAPAASPITTELFQGTVAPSGTVTLPFVGTAGQRIYADSLPISGSSALISILDPLGNSVFNFYNDADVEDLVLPRSGGYTIQVTDVSGVGTDYNLRLTSLASAATINIGDVVSGSFVSQEAYLYRFNNSTLGRGIIFDGLNDHLTNDNYIRLISPSGNVVEYRTDNDYEIRLEEIGEYYIAARRNDALASDFSFQLLEKSTLPTLSLDTLTTVPSTPAVNLVAYRFNVVAGQRLFFEYSNEVNTSVYISITDLNDYQRWYAGTLGGIPCPLCRYLVPT